MSNESRLPAILLRNLKFSYEPDRTALDEIHLSMAEGEKVALIGPNGAGKSTLIHHLNGLLPDPLPASSAVEIFGTPAIPSRATEIRRMVGMIFQHPDDQLFCQTVFEDVAFGPVQYGLSAESLDQTVQRALEQVGLSGFGDRAPDRLSQGEKRRVCLAGVLVCEPRILAFDEPTSDLDPRGKKHLQELLRQLPQTMLIASHDLDWLLELCPRTILLNRGRIVADGPTQALMGNKALMLDNGLELPISLETKSP